jgi:PAS domain S-box-containing protein
MTLGVMVVVTLAVNALLAARDFDDARATAAEDVRDKVRLAADAIDQDLIVARTTLAAQASAVAPILLQPALAPQCRLTYAAQGFFSEGRLDVFQPDGTVLCSSAAESGAPPGATYAGQPWLAELGQDKSPAVLVPVHADFLTGHPGVLVAAPVTGPDGALAGYMAMFGSAKELPHNLRRFYGDPEHDTFGVHRDNLVLASTSTTDINVKVREEAGDLGAIRTTDGLDGVKRLFTAAATADLGWVVYAGVSEKQALAPAYDELRDRGVVAGVTLLALALMAVIIHRRIARPMRRVTGAVAAAGADPTARIEEEGPRELQELSRSFNHLLEVRSEAIATSVRHSALRRLDAVVKVAPAAIVTADSAGRIIDWNPAAEKLFGWSEGEIIGQPVSVIIPERLRGAHDAGLASLAAGGEPMVLGDGVVELTGLRKDGGEIPVELSLARWEEDQLGVHYALLIRDVSALQAALRAKSEFIRTLSHELRTPLTALIGAVDLLSDEEASDDKQHERLGFIRVGAEQVQHLVSDILDLSKAEAGQARVEAVPFPIADVVDNAVGLGRAQLGSKDVRIRAEVDPGVPALVSGDAAKVGQILLNLVGNAAKFTDRGRIDLRVEPAEDDNIRFTVSDTGIGMSPEAVEHVFAPFFQVETGSTRRHRGTGIGLTISQRYAQLMGGTLTVRSREGEGSAFTLTIPLPASDAPAPVAPPVPLSAWNGPPRGRILLAEDEPASQTVVSFMLTHLGFEVDAVGDGVEALAAYSARTYDLVFMDGMMPELNGFDATRAIRASELAEGRRRTPVIALTAAETDEDRDLAREVGMDDYLPKPVRLVDLGRVVQAHLARETSTQQA